MNTPAAPNSKTGPSPDDLSEQIEALRADLARITATAKESIVEGVGSAGRKIEQTGRDARASVTDAVLKHPLAAVGIAAGLGFVLGMITRKS